jgi:hypothetical protein
VLPITDRLDPDAGVRHFDDFRPTHNLESLSDLTAALFAIVPEQGLTTWQGMARGVSAPMSLT